MLSCSTPEEVVRKMVSAMSCVIESRAFLKSSNAIGSKRPDTPPLSLLAKFEKRTDIAAEYRVLLGRGQERAILANIVDALPIGAEPLDIWHVRAPYQP